MFGKNNRFNKQFNAKACLQNIQSKMPLTAPEKCPVLKDEMNSSEDKECKEENKNEPQESATKVVDVVAVAVSSNRSNVQEPQFYGKAQKYWSEVPATVNGMLGGLGYISAIDVQGSNTFLREIRVPGNKLALDCGAGIGRVTRNLLIPRFHCVDIVEQDPAFANKAREYCTTESQPVGSLGEIYNVGLQKFTPTKKYDLIWSQWVLGHLTELDLVDFFRRMGQGLAPGGFFVMKENVTKSKEIIDDDEDSSVTRPLEHYEISLKAAGFRIVRKVRQQNFPKDLYPVYMIACKPLSVA